MKEINTSIFIGVLLALPVIYLLNNDPLQSLGSGAIALVLFLTIGLVHLINHLRGKKGDENVKT